MITPYDLKTIPLDVFPYLRSAALMVLMAAKSGPPFVVKTHCANSMVNRTRLIPYEMTRSSVVLVRDPRDIVVSYARHFKETYDRTITLMGSTSHVMGIKEDGFNYVPQYPASWSWNVNSWIEDKHWGQFECIQPLVVKYEDLLQDPKKYFLEMLKLWEIEPRNVDKVLELTDFHALRRQEDENGFLERKFEDVPFFNTGKTGTWKHELSKSQVNQITKDHGDVMEKMGYI